MTPENFWQTILAPDATAVADETSYPARFEDGRILRLPLRPLPDGEHALASLIINQASFSVSEALASALAARLAPFAPDLVVGLPTLGLTLAAAVAQKLGHARYLPLGMSAKFWYREDLSVPLSSITTPGQTKRLYIDPRLLPLLQDRRIVLIDDVISTGVSMAAGIELLAAVGARPVALGAAMLQSARWRGRLAAFSRSTQAVLASPIFERRNATWIAKPAV